MRGSSVIWTSSNIYIRNIWEHWEWLNVNIAYCWDDSSNLCRWRGRFIWSRMMQSFGFQYNPSNFPQTVHDQKKDYHFLFCSVFFLGLLRYQCWWQIANVCPTNFWWNEHIRLSGTQFVSGRFRQIIKTNFSARVAHDRKWVQISNEDGKALWNRSILESTFKLVKTISKNRCPASTSIASRFISLANSAL